MLLSGDLLRWNAERILIMKHITGLAHIALFTKDLETSIKFYECLGGKVTGQADVQKPLGTNHIKIVSRAVSSRTSQSKSMTSTLPSQT